MKASSILSTVTGTKISSLTHWLTLKKKKKKNFEVRNLTETAASSLISGSSLLRLKTQLNQVSNNMTNFTAPKLFTNLQPALNKDVLWIKSPTKCILTADDVLHDKYTCNFCSARPNIRPANAADMAQQYFLFSPQQHNPLPRLSPTPLSLHNPPSAHQFTQGQADRGATREEIQTPGKYDLCTQPESLNCYKTKRCIYSI